MARIVKNIPRYHFSICVTTTLKEIKQIAENIEKQIGKCNLKILDYETPVKLTNGSEINFALLSPAINRDKILALNFNYLPQEKTKKKIKYNITKSLK